MSKDYVDREGVKERLNKMSDWQFHLFILNMGTHGYVNGEYDPPTTTIDYIVKNPARFVMYIAFCVGLRPWLWFGVAK